MCALHPQPTLPCRLAHSPLSLFAHRSCLCPAHSISEGINKQSYAQEVGTLSQHRVAVAIFLLLPRLAFLTIYANIW
jgi:hypothetical protein